MTLALGIVWLLAACSGGTEVDGPPTDDDESDVEATGGGTSTGGQATGGAPETSTGGSPEIELADIREPLPGPFGKITLRSIGRLDTPHLSYRFRVTPEYEGCVLVESIGDCHIWDCPELPESPNPTGPTTVQVQSGAMVSSMIVGETTTGSLPPLQVGDLVTFTAAGGEVPSFTQELVYPGPFMLVSPALTGTSLEVDSTVDLNLEWSAGATASVSFQAFGQMINGRYNDLLCYYPEGSTEGLVPAKLLTDVGPVDSAGFYSIVARNITSGGMTVQMRLASNVNDASGNVVTVMLN